MSSIKIHHAKQSELVDINRIIEAAVMTWDLPDRVKRLSLSSYHYNHTDFDHFEIIVAKDGFQNIVGVAAWERADIKDTPLEQTALLLHGIYVEPSKHRKGIGEKLFKKSEQAVRNHQLDGLLVKAQEKANLFFISQGMKKLENEDASRHYTNRFWKNISNKNVS